MSVWPGRGEVWGAQVNAHRHGWDGSICNDPCNWDCGGASTFRRNYCDRGDGRCFHLRAFHPTTPEVTAHDKGLGWLMEEDPRSLEDQILLLYASAFGEPSGITARHDSRVVGFYVVQLVEAEILPYTTIWRVVPHPGRIGLLHELDLPLPRYRSARGPYLKQFDAGAVDSLRRNVERALLSVPDISQRTKQDADMFLTHLDEWLDAASRTNDKLRAADHGADHQVVYSSADSLTSNPFAALSGFKPASRTADESHASDLPPPPPAGSSVHSEPPPDAPASTGAPSARPAAPDAGNDVSAVSDSPQVLPLLDDAALARLASDYGSETARGLWLAGLAPNALILLRGAPGIGKSRLATSLAVSQRRHVVTVGSTWRGREDLIGYVEPVSGQFRPTPFLDFIRQCAMEFDAGDTAPRICVFEEFNLAPPEYWFSDFLALSQYPITDRELRRIEVGGSTPTHWSERPATLWLPPNLRFIGTMNSDHTTRVLSPRVLDRASLVSLSLSVDEVVKRAGLNLEEAPIEAVRSLDDLLAARGVRFSIRVAHTTARGLRSSEPSVSSWLVLDHALLGQVLSRVMLHAGDPVDHKLVENLVERWSEEYGSRLPLCAARIEQWAEMLDNGQDVVQA